MKNMGEFQTMARENIVLIGMSGAGKSTLGVLLAKALGMDFLDTDILIQQTDGRLLQNIIDEKGNAYFLDLEERVVSSVNAENSVIATGGSVVYSAVAMKELRKNATVVYLHVDFEEIEKRLKNITSRGIVFKNAATLRQVYDERLDLYQRYADITVDCTGKGIEECVSELLSMKRK